MLSNRLWLKRVHQDQDCQLVDKTSKDVKVAANDVEIPTFRSTFRSTIRPSLDVDKRVSVVRQKLWLRHEAGTTGSSSD